MADPRSVRFAGSLSRSAAHAACLRRSGHHPDVPFDARDHVGIGAATLLPRTTRRLRRITRASRPGTYQRAQRSSMRRRRARAAPGRRRGDRGRSRRARGRCARPQLDGAVRRGRPPGSRRSRRFGRRATRCSTGNVPGAWRSHARQRRASTTPGATMAPVGHPSRHRSAAPVGDGGRRRRDDGVGHRPSEHEPAACPGTSSNEFLPYHLMPAPAASRSTMALSSATTRRDGPSSAAPRRRAPRPSRRRP